MISPVNGEVGLKDGLCIGAHSQLATISAHIVSSHDLPVPGWSEHSMGTHPSDHGEFEVNVITGEERRVEALYFSHCHSFYEAGTPDDAERRVYHEGVIASDLGGQREFGWGRVFCRVRRDSHKSAGRPAMIVMRDWIWIVYNPFSDVPLRSRSIEMLLAAHEPLPPGGD